MITKDRHLGVRIDPELDKKLMSEANYNKLSKSKFVEKALRFVLGHREEFIEYEEGNPLQEEYMKLNKNPEASLRTFKSSGIQTRGQLYWVADRLQQAWSSSSGMATAAWIAKVVLATELLTKYLDISTKSNKELMKYLLSTFPAEGQTLEEKIHNAHSFLNSVNKIEAFHADLIARCLLSVVRDGSMQIPDAVLNDINKLFSPWYVWVVRRGMQKVKSADDIDTSMMTAPYTPPNESTEIKSSNVLVKIFFSNLGKGPFRVGKRSFFCTISIPFIDQQRVTFNCDAQTFYDLLEAIAQIRQDQELSTFGSWQVTRNPIEGIYLITKNDITIFLSHDKFMEFVEIVHKIYENEYVQKELLIHHLEVQGAL